MVARPSFDLDVGVAVDAVGVVCAGVVEEVLKLQAPTAVEIAVASAEGSRQPSARAWSRRRQGEEEDWNKFHQPP